MKQSKQQQELDAILEKYKSQAYEYSPNTDIIGWYDAANAMREYADAKSKETAIDFAEWMQKYTLYDYSKKPYKYITRLQPNYRKSKPKEFTAAELYELYLQSK